jgi:GNAT superfamily N-acetyltransferase
MSPITPATVEMAAALTRLALASKGHWGYPAAWIEEWSKTLIITPEFIRRAAVFVVLDDDPVAFYGLEIHGSCASLAHLWVLPDRIGQGIGRRLFQHAIAEAEARGCETVLIEAEPNAEKFYATMGARRIGTSIGEVLGNRRELPLMQVSLSARGSAHSA